MRVRIVVKIGESKATVDVEVEVAPSAKALADVLADRVRELCAVEEKLVFVEPAHTDD